MTTGRAGPSVSGNTSQHRNIHGKDGHVQRNSEAWTIAYREHIIRQTNGIGCTKHECPVCARLAAEIRDEGRPRGTGVVDIDSWDD